MYLRRPRQEGTSTGPTNGLKPTAQTVGLKSDPQFEFSVFSVPLW